MKDIYFRTQNILLVFVWILLAFIYSKIRQFKNLWKPFKAIYTEIPLNVLANGKKNT